MRYQYSLIIALIIFVLPVSLSADDWPQWMGPNRDSVWRESGIVDKFPEKGLKVKWRVPVNLGYGGPAVANGKIYLMDFIKKSGRVTNSPGTRDHLEGVERILCFDSKTGKRLWKQESARTYRLSYPRGPRCTPTISGGKAYCLGAEGHLACLDAENGNILWEKDLKKEYKTKSPIWGFAAHPLVWGDYLFCVVGGTGSVAVAFDKNSGKEVWKALSAGTAGYCPPTMITHNGTEQLLIWHPDSINSLQPKTGRLNWSVGLKPDYEMSIAAPRKVGNKIFASGIVGVGAMLELGSQPASVEVLWRGTTKTALYPSVSTPIMENGMIYGNDGVSGTLVAARMEDGKRTWQTAKPTTGKRGKRHGTVFLVKHEDRFLLFNDAGDLILAKMTPENYSEISRFHVLEPTNSASGRDVVWSHPAFAEKSLFARNDKELVCVDLSSDQ